jgi:hypothetical protein
MVFTRDFFWFLHKRLLRASAIAWRKSSQCVPFDSNNQRVLRRQFVPPFKYFSHFVCPGVRPNGLLCESAGSIEHCGLYWGRATNRVWRADLSEKFDIIMQIYFSPHFVLFACRLCFRVIVVCLRN